MASQRPSTREKFLLLLFLLVVSSFQLSSQIDDGSEPKVEFPSLWDAIEPENVYHAIYQIQISEKAELLMVEEWADFNQRLFRLDLISDTNRKSYLMNGVTGEIHRYVPYSCALLEPGASEDLNEFAALFHSYTVGPGGGGTGVKIYGLGALWLHSKLDKPKVSARPYKPAEGKVDIESLRGATIYSFPLKKLAPDDMSYDMNFWFMGGGGGVGGKNPTKKRFLEVVEWLQTDKGGKRISIARLRVMNVELKIAEQQVFRLPAGYGCRRAPSVEKIAAKLGSFDLAALHMGAPNQVELLVTSSRPLDEKHNEWQSRRYTAKLMRGSFRIDDVLQTYYVSSLRELDDTTARAKREKQIWWASQADSQLATVYKLDRRSSTCKVSHEQVQHSPRLAFPSRKEDEERDGYQMALSVKQVIDLLNDLDDDYHMIWQQVGGLAGGQLAYVAEAHYENRLEEYSITSASGEPIWSGPASIVKKITRVAADQLAQVKPDQEEEEGGGGDVGARSWMEGVYEEYQEAVSLLLFNKDTSEIVYKITLEMAGKQEIDVRLFQSQLDIGSCLASSRHQQVTLRYGLESPEVAERLASIRDLVVEFFLTGLFWDTPIEPHQISQIDVEFDSFFMYLSFDLLELPLTQSCRPELGRQLSATPPDSVSERFAGSAEACAESCLRLACGRFSFEPVGRRCRIDLTREAGAAGVASSPTEPAARATTWECPRAAVRARDLLGHITAAAERAAAEAGAADEQDPLLTERAEACRAPTICLRRLLLPDTPTRIDEPLWLVLRPVALEGAGPLGEERTGSGLEAYRRAEYELVGERREFKPSASGYKLLVGPQSYEDCALACDTQNCNSFSHCSSSERCILSSAHDQQEVTSSELSVFKRGCAIYALDYLSKFEPLGAWALDWRTDPASVRAVAEGGVEGRAGVRLARLCASLCMKAARDSPCEGFHACEPSQVGVAAAAAAAAAKEPARCLLRSRHVNELLAAPDASERDSGAGAGAGLAPEHEAIVLAHGEQRCNFYSRSYLSHFNEYHFKRFSASPALRGSASPASSDSEQPSPRPSGEGADDDDDGSGSVLLFELENSSADECARECVRRSCPAFHVCVSARGGGAGPRLQTCSLASSPSQLAGLALVPEPDCSAYLLADRTLVAAAAAAVAAATNPANLEEQKPDVAATPAAPEPSEAATPISAARPDSGGSILSSLLAGFALGLLLGFAWRQRDAIYVAASSRFGRLSNGPL